jgi:AraC-like DNA-binding protein
MLKNVSLHHHDFYEVYFFVKGEVNYKIEGRDYELKPGDVLLLNYKELHQALIENPNQLYERYVLWLNRDFLASLSSEKTDLRRCFEDKEKKNLIRTTIENQQLIRGILDKLLYLEGSKEMGHDLLYKAYITELMVALNRISFDEESRIQHTMKKNQLIDSVIHYINENLEENITMDSLSNEFYISKYHLSREFKKHTGITLYRFIVKKRLIRSKELILEDLPITSVYERCGFGDYSNFFRAFKCEYGITPKKFYELMTEVEDKDRK